MPGTPPTPIPPPPPPHAGAPPPPPPPPPPTPPPPPPVFVLHHVIRVGIGRDDLLEAGLLQGLQVLLPEQAEQPLLAEAPGVVARVLLALVEDPEVEPGTLEHAGRGPGHALHPGVVGGVVPDDPEPLDGLLPRILDREVQARRPTGAGPGGLAKRVAVSSQIHEHVLDPDLHVSPGDEVPPHLDDQRNVLVEHGAPGHAGHAGRTRPDFLPPDDVPHEARFLSRVAAGV